MLSSDSKIDAVRRTCRDTQARVRATVADCFHYPARDSVFAAFRYNYTQTNIERVR